MANTFINIKEVARQLLPRLIDNLVFPNLVYKDYSAEYVAGKGATVIAQKPYTFTASEFSDGSTVTAQDIKQNGVEVVLDKLATVDVEWGSIEAAVNMSDQKVAQILEGMAAALATKMNSDGVGLYKDIPYNVGTAGTTPNSLSAFSDARKKLNTNKAPLDMRRAVWNVDADAAFTQIGDLVKVGDAGTTRALREGEIGRVFGMDNYMTQAIGAHTPGTAISGSKTFAVGTAASAGATAVDLKLSADTGTVVKGDLLTIDGYQYVIVSDSVSLSTTKASVDIYPALAAAITTSSVVAYVGSSTVTTYVNNLAFHQNAFAFVTRPLVQPNDKEAYTTAYNSISLRVVKGYDMTKKRTMLSADLVYGYKTLCPELATRILG